MHFDLAHALVSGVLIFAIMKGMQKAGYWVPYKTVDPSGVGRFSARSLP